jgi:peptidoglycan/xylan/chitin deacetylase (PgdA/CDA1 family)
MSLFFFLFSLERPRYVLLSFDVEPVDGDGSVSLVLASLERMNAKRSAAGVGAVNVTFFVTGEYALKNRDVLARMRADGFEIACHSFSHPLFLKRNVSQKRDEIFRCERALVIAGVPKPVGFRAPYTILDFETAGLLERNGFVYDASALDYSAFLYGVFNDTVEVPVSTFLGLPLEDVVWAYYLHSPSLFFWLIDHQYDGVVSVIFHPHHVSGYLSRFEGSVAYLSERNVSFISNYYFTEVTDGAFKGIGAR